MTLATLSFFCRRPTILAILEFVNAINIKDESCESFSDNSSGAILQHDLSGEQVVDSSPSTSAVDEHIVKGLLGMGKSRIIFYLTLNMARAEILLMYENERKLATLSQDNLLTEIKVCLLALFFFFNQCKFSSTLWNGILCTLCGNILFSPF